MEFLIVKAPKAQRAKVRKTKYGRLFTAIEKLKVGDHVIVFSHIEERLVNQKFHNVVRGLRSFKDLLPRRKFEMSTMTSEGGNGNNIIIKRTE